MARMRTARKEVVSQMMYVAACLDMLYVVGMGLPTRTWDGTLVGIEMGDGRARRGGRREGGEGVADCLRKDRV